MAKVFFDFSMVMAGGGNVQGPSSSIDNAIPTFDGTTGKLIQQPTSPTAVTLIDRDIANVDSILFRERSLIPSMSAGESLFWVQNDTPTNPYFTDDADTSHPLLLAPSGFTAGDLLAGGSVANRPSRLAKGTQYQVLRAGSSAPEFAWQGVIDRETAVLSTAGSTNASIPVDNSIPQVGEGAQILSRTYTPKSTSNRIRVRVNVTAGHDHASTNSWTIALFKDGGPSAVESQVNSTPRYGVENAILTYEEPASSTSSQTWTVRIGHAVGGAAKVYWNSAPFTGTQIHAGVLTASIEVEEIAA